MRHLQVLLLVGFGAPYWAEYSDLSLNGYLWRVCANSICVDSVGTINSNGASISNPDWIQATQALAVLYLVAQILAIAWYILLLIFLRVWLKISLICTAGTSLLFGFLCIVIFGAKIDDGVDEVAGLLYLNRGDVSGSDVLGYAYWITVASVIVHIPFFILAFFQPARKSTRQFEAGVPRTPDV